MVVQDAVAHRRRLLDERSCCIHCKMCKWFAGSSSFLVGNVGLIAKVDQDCKVVWSKCRRIWRHRQVVHFDSCVYDICPRKHCEHRHHRVDWWQTWRSGRIRCIGMSNVFEALRCIGTISAARYRQSFVNVCDCEGLLIQEANIFRFVALVGEQFR